MLTLYGIPNCDSCKKARNSLDAAGVDYRFHDVRSDGIDRADIERWLAAVDWRSLLNTRSTTWRGLNNVQKSDVDQSHAIELMLKHPTLIKRPVIQSRSEVVVGFSDQSLAKIAHWTGQKVTRFDR